MAKLFLSYSHADEALKNELMDHLATVRREKHHIWQDRELTAGDELDPAIKAALESADIIILLISHKFLASYYCFEVEFAAAIARHNAGTARVIPVILDHCDWTSTEMSKLLAAPKDGRAIVEWPNQNEAFLDVVKQIRRAIQAIAPPKPEPIEQPVVAPAAPSAKPQPTFSNPFIPKARKTFTDLDRRRACDATFSQIKEYFAKGLPMLSDSDPNIETEFTEIHAKRFVASLFLNGSTVHEIAIWVGGVSARSEGLAYHIGRGISHTAENSFSGMIELKETDTGLEPRLQSWSMLSMNREKSAQTVDETLWRIFTQPLSGR